MQPLKIDGVDITNYIAHRGLKWQRADVEGENAGRVQTGDMERDRVAVKHRLDVTCRPLFDNEAQTVLNAIAPEYVYVSYKDPQIGYRTNVKMYSNNIPATFCQETDDGDMWMGIAFPLIEV